MAESFYKHLAEALAEAPNQAAAHGVIDLMHANDPEVGRWCLPWAIQHAAAKQSPVLFPVLRARGLLEHDFVADAVAKWAAIKSHEDMLDQWARHPQAQKMASGPRGEAMLTSMIQQGNAHFQRDEALAHLLRPDLRWAQGTLDALFYLCMTSRASTQKEYAKDSCLRMLLASGADPTHTPPSTGKQRQSAFILVNGHMGGDASAARMIESLRRSKHWKKFIELSERGKSMPWLLSSRFHCKELEEGLDDAPQRWWDNDPYGLLDLIVKRAYREPALLIGMCDRAQQQGITTGLPQALMPRIFSGLFQSCGKGNNASVRADFWQGSAMRMAHLWGDGNAWPQACRMAHAFELEQGGSATVQQREAFMQSVALALSTAPAAAITRSRSL